MKCFRYLLLTFFIFACTEDKPEIKTTTKTEPVMVWVCRNRPSYHKYESCKSLSFLCDGKILKVTIEEAKTTQYSPCKSCYNIPDSFDSRKFWDEIENKLKNNKSDTTRRKRYSKNYKP